MKIISTHNNGQVKEILSDDATIRMYHYPDSLRIIEISTGKDIYHMHYLDANGCMSDRVSASTGAIIDGLLDEIGTKNSRVDNTRAEANHQDLADLDATIARTAKAWSISNRDDV